MPQLWGIPHRAPAAQATNVGLGGASDFAAKRPSRLPDWASRLRTLIASTSSHSFLCSRTTLAGKRGSLASTFHSL